MNETRIVWIVASALVACSTPSVSVQPAPIASTNAVTSAAPPAVVTPPPAASSAARVEPAPASAPVLSVAVTRGGAVSVDGQPVRNDEELAAIVKSAKERDPNSRAVINADRDATYGTVIHTLDVIRRAGIDAVSFGVAAPPSATPPAPAPSSSVTPKPKSTNPTFL